MDSLKPSGNALVEYLMNEFICKLSIYIYKLSDGDLQLLVLIQSTDFMFFILVIHLKSGYYYLIPFMTINSVNVNIYY